MGCSPPEMPGCWYLGGLGKLFTFCLVDRKFLTIFFVGIPFVSFYKTAESVTQQIRICPCKTQMVTTGTRQPLVASQYHMYFALKIWEAFALLLTFFFQEKKIFRHLNLSFTNFIKLVMLWTNGSRCLNIGPQLFKALLAWRNFVQTSGPICSKHY